MALHFYDLVDYEDYDLMVCETCGMDREEHAYLDTGLRTVEIFLFGCFENQRVKYSLEEFEERFKENNKWQNDSFNALMDEVEEMLENDR